MKEKDSQIETTQNHPTNDEHKSTSVAKTKSNSKASSIKFPNINLPPTEVVHSNQSISMKIKPVSISTSQHKKLSLPTFKPPSKLAISELNNLEHPPQITNSLIAINILKKIELIIGNWNKELKQILKKIEDIYAEGPIVNAWLESDYGATKVDIEKFIYSITTTTKSAKNKQNKSNINIPSDYHLDGLRICGLDENGELWCRPCPPEQVHSISIAIARYQKLQQLLVRKQSLENRLSQLAETLMVLHNHLQE